MELKSYYAQDKNGETIPGAYVYLYEEGTTTLVTGIKDANGSSLSNPFQADEDGLFQLAAPDGFYDLRVSSTGRDNTLKIQFLDAAAAVQIITSSADRAESEADRSEAAKDAAFVNADAYADIASGLAAVADGDQFQVVSEEEIIRYERIDATTELEVARYPSSLAVKRPLWAGKVNGFPDPFFRHLEVGAGLYGRGRWKGAESSATSVSLVISSSPFDGKALRKTGRGNLYGPIMWLDEMGATAGEKITIKALIRQGVLSGGSGGVFALPCDISGYPAGPQFYLRNESGDSYINLTSSLELVSVTLAIPSGAAYFWVYPATGAADPETDMDVVALWAHKGAASEGPSWPIGQEELGLRLQASYQQAQISVLRDTLSDNQTRTAYAVDAYWTIDAESESVELSGSGYTDNSRDLVFMGWGEEYSPAGVSFNAIRIKSISRDPSTTAKWRTLNVVVRTGENPSSSGSEVVAVGSAYVLESSDSLSDVDVLLKDPLTGSVKTLSDGDFSGGAYFIGVYAYTAEGNPAACGEPRGSMPNSLLQSYYFVSTRPDPINASWDATSPSTNKRLAFEHIMMISPKEGFKYIPTKDLLDNIESMLLPNKPEIVIPPAIYAVEGRECNVYLDNLHLSDASDYLHDVNADAGAQQNERFTWTPAGAMTSGSISVAVHDKRTGAKLLSVSSGQRAASASAGTGTIRKVLIIGDSLIAAGDITQTLLDIAGSDVMGIQLLGTLGGTTNKHEGRGGWTVARYASDDIENPFWIGGQFDFPQYLIDNQIDTPDWVFIHLGINDVFGQTSDTGAEAAAQSAFSDLDTIIASIKAADPAVNVGLMIPTPPSSDQDSFGANYGDNQTRWKFKRNILIWAREMISSYSGQEASRIYLVPSNTSLDTVHNMSRSASEPVNSRSSVMVERQSNGVHPATEGYQQIGDALWAFIKCNV